MFSLMANVNNMQKYLYIINKSDDFKAIFCLKGQGYFLDSLNYFFVEFFLYDFTGILNLPALGF